MEILFNSPRLYRAKFFFTGALTSIVKPICFRNHFRFREILAERIRPGETVCEIGCGDGENYRFLLADVGNISFTGLDLNPHMIEHCRARHPEARWVCCNLAEVAETQRFDACVVCNVLHHLNSRKDALTVLQTATRISRRLLLCEPLQSDIWPLPLLKRLYWTLTDGGNFYMRLEEFHAIFAEAHVTVDWEMASEPLHHFYVCQLSRMQD